MLPQYYTDSCCRCCRLAMHQKKHQKKVNCLDCCYTNIDQKVLDYTDSCCRCSMYQIQAKVFAIELIWQVVGNIWFWTLFLIVNMRKLYWYKGKAVSFFYKKKTRITRNKKWIVCCKSQYVDIIRSTLDWKISSKICILVQQYKQHLSTIIQ